MPMINPSPASQIADVTPNVLAAGGSALDLIGLVLTTSTRPPIGAAPSFPDAASVGEYFGLSSHEKAVADVYFGGFDNSNKKPASVLFAQYNQTAVAAYVRGAPVSSLTLTQLQAITGTLTAVVDGYPPS